MAAEQDPVKRTVTVGKLKMSLFAFITALCGILLGLITAFKVNLYVGLVLTASFFIAAYNINCVIVGKCNTWAWILLIIYLLNTIIAVAGNLFGGSSSRSSSKSKK